jgi:hypothetical protein
MIRIKVLMMSLVLALGVISASSQEAHAQVVAPVTGIFADALGGVGEFSGTLQVTQFVREGVNIVAQGLLTGTLTDSAGNVIGTVTDFAVNLPITGADGSCQILFLELGPLSLDLLGLQVFLDQVVLEIVAQAGAGRLLGNLLCAVAGLLDSNASLNAITNMLNRILGLLN